MVQNTLKPSIKAIGRAFIFILIFCFYGSYAQNTNVFYVKFNQKDSIGSPEQWLGKKAIERRTKYNIPTNKDDFPVNRNYINEILKDTLLHLRYTLKWHNAAVISADKENLDELLELPFVDMVKYVGIGEKDLDVEQPNFSKPRLKLKESDMSTTQLTIEDYGVSYHQNNQIGVVELHQNGFSGKGIEIAIFDAGFRNIDKIPAFLKHQSNGLLTYGYDVAGLDNNVISSDNHGTACASCFGAYDKGKYIGSAPNAGVTLFRTEYGSSEYPLEELNWCKAAELADSMGIDLISSSLGYNMFDDKRLSYTHKDLDGKTSYVSKAARIAVEKGIVVLNSAGNQGDNKWRKIGTPADVASILTIGAVDLKNNLGKFSSQGNNALGVIKPDISSCGVLAWVASPGGGYYQGYGTSYATPIAAGGVACLMQAYPELSPLEINNLVRITATQSDSPDSLMGYGVAQLDVAYKYQQQKKLSIQEPKFLKVDEHQAIISIPKGSKLTYNIFYHKKFLGLFNIKKTVKSGNFDETPDIARINFTNFKIKCSKKYTLKVDLKSPVGKYTLKYNDLSLCND